MKYHFDCWTICLVFSCISYTQILPYTASSIPCRAKKPMISCFSVVKGRPRRCTVGTSLSGSPLEPPGDTSLLLFGLPAGCSYIFQDIQTMSNILINAYKLGLNLFNKMESTKTPIKKMKVTLTL